MKFINKATLFFVVFSDSLNKMTKRKTNKDDDFLKLLLEVQNDEYIDSFSKQIERFNLLRGEINFGDYQFQARVIGNNFLQYDTSNIYLRLDIDNEAGIPVDEFAKLISGSTVLDECQWEGKTVRKLINGLGYELSERNFLFTQIIKTSDDFPVGYQEGLDFIDTHKQRIHQFLLRSDTRHDHLRIDNHVTNLESIANFYGTIDLCSPIHLMQFYQYPIESVTQPKSVYDIEHRACWWLTITDVIFIQQQILQEVLENLNNLEVHDRSKFMQRLADLEKILIKMKGFWHFEEMVHEISKKVVNKVKERVGLEDLMNNVQERIRSIENRTLRELNQVQNKQNDALNIILLILAGLQIIPLVYDALNHIYDPAKVVNLDTILRWTQAISITTLIPLIFWKRNSISKIFQYRNDQNLKA